MGKGQRKFREVRGDRGCNGVRKRGKVEHALRETHAQRAKDGSGKHQQGQQERRQKDPRIKREKEAGKDWECERPRQTAGKVQAGGSRVVSMGDPENDVTTHRAVDKTRAIHRPGAQEARQEQ